MARIDRLQDTLTQHRDELTVNHSAIERVERIARSAREDVRSISETIGAMTRQIGRLDEEIRQLRGDP